MTTVRGYKPRKGTSDGSLRELVKVVIADLYRSREDFTYQVVEDRLKRTPGYWKARGQSRRFERYGLNGVIRPVLKGLRFTAGPYAGTRALQAIPVQGKRMAALRFSDRLTVSQWRDIAGRYSSTVRSNSIMLNGVQNIVQDLLAKQAVGLIGQDGTLEQAYGTMAIGL